MSSRFRLIGFKDQQESLADCIATHDTVTSQLFDTEGTYGHVKIYKVPPDAEFNKCFIIEPHVMFPRLDKTE